MVPGIHRPAVVKVNLGAIKRNLKNEMGHLEPGQKMLAVVKANGYGHGAVEVARVADKVGAAGFCVAILDEALELRRADITKPILVLGVVSPEYAPITAVNNVSLTVPNLEWLKEAEKYLKDANLQLKIHLGIDSGMETQTLLLLMNFWRITIISLLKECLPILLLLIAVMKLISNINVKNLII